jgi:hypothetical protein
MATARAILSPEQQNIERRLRDCDGCHNPEHRPVYRMMVDIGSVHTGGLSQSVFLICESCSRSPIQLYMHGSGRCAPGIRVVDDAHTLGKADLDRQTAPSGKTVVEEVVEPPVEVVDSRDDPHRWGATPKRPKKPRKKPHARARPGTIDALYEAETVSALDHCAYCHHQRGFHINGPCGFSTGRGCSCRRFEEVR